MTTLISDLNPIDCLSGVQPTTDKSALTTQHYTYAKGIRFRFGKPQKLGGWRAFNFLNGELLTGVARSLASAFFGTRGYSVIGTNTRVYSLLGQSLLNITPLLTDTNAIPNSLSTNYGTLASNPLTTTLGSSTIAVADTNASKYKPSDLVTLSGATGTGGILAGAINGQHIIRSIGVNKYTISAATVATSNATGGGASVVRSTGLITVTDTAHGMLEEDRVKITLAGNTGGILAAAINLEFIIRNVTANTFDIFTSGTATSAVTAAGGSATLYQKELPAGAVNESFGQGYGQGLYGAGLYGVSKTSASGRNYPRIWYFDRYGDTFIMTPGNQGGVYSWDGDTVAAPVLVQNAPIAVNYAFVSNNILVTFGAGDVQNKVFASDQGDITNWTASSTNQVFEDNIEGAGRLVSHIPVNGTNILFTEQQSYLFTYIGLPFVWQIQSLDPGIGIIASMARVVVKGVAYWMGTDNFYRWQGGNVDIIPANSQLQSTILNYVFSNINTSQKSKIFCWYNKAFDEIWFHYPSAGSNECDRIARVCLQDMSWTPDEMDRTCAEYPFNTFGNPRLINSTLMYVHETGSDDDITPLEFSLTTNKRTNGKKNTFVVGIIPDSQQTGDIDFHTDAYQFPQSVNKSADSDYTVLETSERIPTQVQGRYIQYTWSGAVLGQDWRMGSWQEYIQAGAPN